MIKSLAAAAIGLVTGALAMAFIAGPLNPEKAAQLAAPEATQTMPLVAPASDNAAATSGAGATLAAINARGYLKCGVSTGLQGFSYTDDTGTWQGFDVDVCRAVAAAVFGDANKVKYTATTNKIRFTALASGEIDLLSRNTTWTFTRDVDLKFSFAGVNYYDGQGFIAPKALGITSSAQLGGASICVQTGTTTELNLADFMEVNNIDYEPVPIATVEEARANYLAGRCDVFTTDASGLAATRATFDNPDDHLILPEIISKEPLGPVVRQGDDQWADIVRWSLNVLINAEDYGISSENVDSVRVGTENKEIQRMLGTLDNFGSLLGLGNDWAYNIISQVGNYGEIFERHIGAETPIGLARGLNALWHQGGLIYAPPIR